MSFYARSSRMRSSLIVVASGLIMLMCALQSEAQTCEELFRRENITDRFQARLGSGIQSDISQVFIQKARARHYRAKVLVDEVSTDQLFETLNVISRAFESAVLETPLMIPRTQWVIEVVVYSKDVENLLVMSAAVRDLSSRLDFRYRFEQLDPSDPIHRRRAQLERSDIFIQRN